MARQRVTVRVPATTGNLGPAFDCMGLALDLYATVTLERSSHFGIEIRGHGSRELSRGEDNLVYRSVQDLYERLGRPAPSLHLRCHNTVPINRGLGSSAAAVVGGLVAGDAMEQSDLSQAELLRLSVGLEGHPDNVAPALLGGCQIVVSDAGRLVTSAVPVKRGLRAALFIPDVEMPTKEARAVLPEKVDRADAVHNVGRAGLLVMALSQGRWDLLGVATQDRLHQPYRRALFPAMQDLFEAARGAGAAGVFLSGAGPTVLALVPGDPAPAGQAMAEAARLQGIGGSWKRVAVGARGAQVVEAA